VIRSRQAIAVLALAGFFIALYLWLHSIGVIGQLKCGTGGCEIVQASAYARLGGVPVAFFGVAGYAALFLVSVVGQSPRFAERRGPGRLLFGLASGGLLFTLYLTSLEAFVIHAWCRWCLGSALVILLIWIAAVAGLARSR